MPDILVNLFVPCFVDQLYPNTAFNMVKILKKLGCKVNYNPQQTCCGQPAFNAGFWEDAKIVGQKFIQDMEAEKAYVVGPSGSCVGFVRGFYNELFENTATHNDCKNLQKKIFEFSEFLVDVLGVEQLGAQLEGLATFHDSCGALRECHIKEAPRKLLANVKGLELKEMNECETCCGFGGTFAVKYEPISLGMANQKIENALKTGAKYIISTDMSCLMHIDGVIKKQNQPIEVMHIADVLASGWN